MNEYESKIRNYYELRPMQFSTLQLFTLSQGIGSGGVCEQSVSLILCKELDDKDECLQIDFYGVRKLNIQQPDWSLCSIGHLEILLGSEIPKIESNYLVHDPEQECIICFECRDFDAFVRSVRDPKAK